MTANTIAQFLQEHPEYRHRKFIPHIVEMLTEVPPEKQIEVKVAIRRLQEAIPNDEKGKKLEANWREERGMQSINELAESVKEFVINGQRVRVKN